MDESPSSPSRLTNDSQSPQTPSGDRDHDVPMSLSNSIDGVNDATATSASAGNKRSFANVEGSVENSPRQELSKSSMSDSFVDVSMHHSSSTDDSFEHISSDQGTSANGEEESRVEQFNRIVEENPVKLGGDCFVCDSNWLESFKKGKEPGEWDPKRITSPCALPLAAGEMIEKWYGGSENRVVGKLGRHEYQDVPMYEPVVHLRVLDQAGLGSSPFRTHVISAKMKDRVGELIDQSIPGVKVRVWKLDDRSNKNEMIEEAEFDQLAKHELTSDMSLLSIGVCPEEVVVVQFLTNILPRGELGLNNLGNTCYMNSALQCLMHVEELACYFLSKQYKNDLNTDNPIGYSGDVAKAFGALVMNMFSDRGDKSFAPSHFKSVIGRHASLFSGFGQQDSQELLAFLLDGLHEDLNKIHKKPATEKPELPDDMVGDAKAVAALAKECWETHKKRNDSVILDLFTGMYQSTLICPVCDKVSITFDPFMDLTLPLPVDTHWVKNLLVIPLNSEPQQLKVVMNKHDSIKDLKAYVADKLDTAASRLHVADVFKHGHFAHLYDPDIISIKISQNDHIVVTEFEHELSESAFLVPVYQFVNSMPVGTPFVVSFTHEEARDRVAVEQKLTSRAQQVSQWSQDVVEFGHYSSVGRHNGSLYQSIDHRKPVTKLSDRVLESEVQVQAAEEEEAAKEPEEVKEENVDQEMREETEEPEADEQTPAQSVDLSSSSSEESSSAIQLPPVEELVPDTPPQSQVRSTIITNTNVVSELVSPGEALAVFWESNMAEATAPQLPNPAADEAIEKMQVEKQKGIELDACLDLFSRAEVLGEDDVWYCNKCQEMRQATKQIELWSAPEIFTIHLKRFSSVRTFSDKIGNVVNFPIEGLDMSKRLLGNDGQEVMYDLFAVDRHYGGMGGGHYDALVKNFVNGKWFNFNDSFVSEDDPQNAITGAAYLLFYRRRSSEPLGTEEIAGYVTKMRHVNYACEPEESPESKPFRSNGRLLGGGGSGSSSLWNSNPTTLNIKPQAAAAALDSTAAADGDDEMETITNLPSPVGSISSVFNDQSEEQDDANDDDDYDDNENKMEE